MVALAKHEVKKLGLREVRMTCHPANFASRKIIEKNGGLLLGTERQTGELLFAIEL